MNLSVMSNNLNNNFNKSDRSGDISRSMTRGGQKSLVDRLFHEGAKKK